MIMKRLSNQILLLACLVTAAFTLSSCLDSDDDDNGYTNEQIQQAMLSMQGNYTGASVAAISLTEHDSINNVNWSADSIITVSNFPLSNIAFFLNKSTDSNVKAVGEALKALGSTELKINYGYYGMNETAISLVTEGRPLELSVASGGKTVKVKVTFAPYQRIEYTYGIFRKAENKTLFLLTVTELTIDDVPVSLPTTPQILLTSKMKI